MDEDRGDAITDDTFASTGGPQVVVAEVIELVGLPAALDCRGNDARDDRLDCKSRDQA